MTTNKRKEKSELILTILYFVIQETKLAFDGIDSRAEFLAEDPNVCGSLLSVLGTLNLELDRIAALEKVFLVYQTGDSKFVSYLFSVH